MTAPVDPQSNPAGIGGSATPATEPVPATPAETTAPIGATPPVSPVTPAGSVSPATEPVVVPASDTAAPSGEMKIAGETTPTAPAMDIPADQASTMTQPAQTAETLPPIGLEPETPGQTAVPEAPKELEKEDKEGKVEKDDEKEENEPQVVERVIIKEKGKGVGCFGFVRNLTCFVISMVLLLIAAIVAIIIFKPSFITEPLKTFLNADYKPAEVASGTSADTVKNYIDEVTNAENGEVTFQITEDQLTTLVREKFDDNVDVRTGMEENKLQLFIDVAQKGEPLWLIIELTDGGDNLTFSRIGFGRINTPPSLRNFVKDKAFGLVGNVLKDFNFDNSENFAANFVGGDLREGVTIKDVKFAQDLMLVTVEL